MKKPKPKNEKRKTKKLSNQKIVKPKNEKPKTKKL